jgi:hypothetical protein
MSDDIRNNEVSANFQVDIPPKNENARWKSK